MGQPERVELEEGTWDPAPVLHAVTDQRLVVLDETGDEEVKCVEVGQGDEVVWSAEGRDLLLMGKPDARGGFTLAWVDADTGDILSQCPLDLDQDEVALPTTPEGVKGRFRLRLAAL